MTRWTVVLGEVVVTVLCLVAAVASWGRGSVATSFAPAGEMPGFQSTRYVGSWMMLAAFLILLAGVATTDMAARALRAVPVRADR